MLALQSIMAKNYSKKKETATMAGASIVCGVLLLLVYMGLAYLGATVSGIYTSEIGRSELILAIVYAIMGKAGTIIFGIVVGLACLTTAIGLTGIVGGFFSETIFKGKVSYKLIVIVMCVFSAVVSNLGLDRIISIAWPDPGPSSIPRSSPRSSSPSRSRSCMTTSAASLPAALWSGVPCAPSTR